MKTMEIKIKHNGALQSKDLFDSLEFLSLVGNELTFLHNGEQKTSKIRSSRTIYGWRDYYFIVPKVVRNHGQMIRIKNPFKA
jgi:hypothetical protein